MGEQDETSKKMACLQSNRGRGSLDLNKLGM